MSVAALLSALIGLTITIGLVAMNGAAGIGRGIADAGWGIVAVIALHLPQVAVSSRAWRTLVPSPRAPSWPIFLGLRLITEGVNALLPFAQIGGNVVGARLLTFGGVPLSVAGASVVVDVTLEMLSQVAFTLLGLALLLANPGDAEFPYRITGGITAALGLLVVVFIVAQRSGLFRRLESGLLRLARRQNWKGLQDVAGLHRAIVALYKSPRRLLLGGGYHFISWLLGGLEVMVALHVLGVAVGLRDSLIIESLTQAFRALGFAVPGALGIQEGGTILICSLLGIGPQSAIELSLLRRIRELVLGVPGLAVWCLIEGPHLARFTLSKKALPRETVP